MSDVKEQIVVQLALLLLLLLLLLVRNEEICGISSPFVTSTCLSVRDQTASIGNACNEDMLSLLCEPLSQIFLAVKLFQTNFYDFPDLFLTLLSLVPRGISTASACIDKC